MHSNANFFQRRARMTSSPIFAIGPVNNSSHLCFHILNRVYKFLSLHQLIEGPLSMKEGVAMLFVTLAHKLCKLTPDCYVKFLSPWMLRVLVFFNPASDTM